MYLGKITKFRGANSNEKGSHQDRNGASIDEINQAYLKLKRIMRMYEDISDEIEVGGQNSKSKDIREAETTVNNSSKKENFTENFIEIDFTEKKTSKKNNKDEFDLLGLDVTPKTSLPTQIASMLQINANSETGFYADPEAITYDSKINYTNKEDSEDFFAMIVSGPPGKKTSKKSPSFNENNIFL